MRIALSEDTIIEGIKNKERAAYEAFYLKYASVLFSLLLRYLKSRTDAEDLLQETFLKIFASINQFAGEGSFEGWIKRIAVNIALNFIKSKKMQFSDQDYIDETIVEKLACNISASNNLEFDELLKIIELLPEQKRIIFTMYHIEGFKHKEIAQILNITEDGCRSQLSKANKMMAEIHRKINVI